MYTKEENVTFVTCVIVCSFLMFEAIKLFS